jgi:hypothetical protein
MEGSFRVQRFPKRMLQPPPLVCYGKENIVLVSMQSRLNWMEKMEKLVRNEMECVKNGIMNILFW